MSRRITAVWHIHPRKDEPAQGATYCLNLPADPNEDEVDEFEIFANRTAQVGIRLHETHTGADVTIVLPADAAYAIADSLSRAANFALFGPEAS